MGRVSRQAHPEPPNESEHTMSTFRGWTVGLITRVQRAQGEHHYLDADTLRYFNSYGGTHAPVGRDTVFVVESVKPPHGPRHYRVVRFSFTPAPEGGEMVAVTRMDDEIPTPGRANTILTKRVREAKLNALREGRAITR